MMPAQQALKMSADSVRDKPDWIWLQDSLLLLNES
jgi:hypothetical protein